MKQAFLMVAIGQGVCCIPALSVKLKSPKCNNRNSCNFLVTNKPGQYYLTDEIKLCKAP